MQYFITLLFLTFLLTSSSQQTGPDLNRKILFSIGKDEKPVFNGSSVSLSPIGTQVTVLTSDIEGRIYVYENGNKRGPFKDIQATRVKQPDIDPSEYDPIFRKEGDEDYQKYISDDKDGLSTIKLEGKSYGPFQFILEFYSSADKRAFSAIVMKDSKPMIITSSGNSLLLDGQPGYNYISPTLNKMMVTTTKENGDTSSYAVSDSVKDGLIHAKAPEAYIYSGDGKKYGPYDPKKITAFNPAFSKTGGDNWLLTMDSLLYINGKAVKTLYSDKISPANIWLTEDGKRYAIIVYNRIEFNDGAVYNDPLKIRISVEKNKITIWWLSLENGENIVLYSRVV